MTASKIVAAAASGVGGAGLDIDEVFSTFLYTGNSTANRTITNNIDLSGEGGLVWIKGRSSDGYDHVLEDTERGADKALLTNTDGAAQSSGFYGVNQFNSNGFRVDDAGNVNNNSIDYVSWTFRKAPKFFDVVTWTGDGTNDRSISHNLEVSPAILIIKRTDSTSDWAVKYPASLYTGESFTGLYLNKTDARGGTTSTGQGIKAISSTDFTIISSGSNALQFNPNVNNATYVAYLFAHNNSDGEFGPDADQDIIKCGTYTGNGGSTETGSPLAAIDLGFEPQWLMIKRATGGTGNWLIIDNMRGFDVNIANKPRLLANTSGAEASSASKVVLTNSGFRIEDTDAEINADGASYLYMAIRRGPLAAPEDATKVFAIDQPGQTSPTPPRQTSGFPVDFFFWKAHTGTQTWRLFDRLRGKVMLAPNSNDAETSNTYAGFAQDQSLGIGSSSDSATDEIMYMWKRAPSYFDVVAFKGNGSAGHNISHNLGVVPEMMWVKQRPYTSDWRVYHSALGNTKVLKLNDTTASATLPSAWNSTTPTASVFTVGTSNDTNENNLSHIAYLFATVAGVSKVGSYTGNGSTQNIDCGFSNGARFVLIKKTSDTGHWVVFDTVRGIVAGNDARLKLNSTDAEVTSYDDIDAHSAGFTLNNVPLCNTDGASYIFYAIA